MSLLNILGKLFRRNNIIKIFGRDVHFNSTGVVYGCVIIALVGMLFLFLSGNKNSMIYIGNNNVQTTNNFYGGNVADSQSGNVPSMQQIDDIINKAQIDISAVPDGYFIVLQRIFPAVNIFAQRQFDNMHRVRPDVSIGNSFDAYIKKKNPDMHAKRIDCTYLYKESQKNQIPIKCYPVQIMADFDNFLVREYIPKKQNKYINNVLSNMKLP